MFSESFNKILSEIFTVRNFIKKFASAHKICKLISNSMQRSKNYMSGRGTKRTGCQDSIIIIIIVVIIIIITIIVRNNLKSVITFAIQRHNYAQSDTLHVILL